MDHLQTKFGFCVAKIIGNYWVVKRNINFFVSRYLANKKRTYTLTLIYNMVAATDVRFKFSLL